MGLFDFLFKKKEVEEKAEEQHETISEEEAPEEGASCFCGYCEQEIAPGEKRRKMSNGIFHRKCFRKMKKQASKTVFG